MLVGTCTVSSYRATNRENQRGRIMPSSSVEASSFDDAELTQIKCYPGRGLKSGKRCVLAKVRVTLAGMSHERSGYGVIRGHRVAVRQPFGA